MTIFYFHGIIGPVGKKRNGDETDVGETKLNVNKVSA